MSASLPNRPAILYLDQFFLREVTNLKEGNPGVSLGELIRIGVRIGAFICPFSDEHFWESSVIKDPDKRSAQLGWLTAASNGACFKSRESLVALQLIEFVRPGSSQELDFLCKVDVEENKEVLANMQSVWVRRNEDAQKYFSDYNQRRAKGKVLRSIPNEVKRVQQIDVFYHGIADCVAHHLVSNGEYDAKILALFDDRPFGAKVLRELLLTHKADTKELDLILRSVIQTKGHCSPLIHVQSALFESWMLEQKKLEMADMYDLWRISTALPYADILVVDGEQARHLVASGLALKYQAKVFTLKADSLIPLFDEIKERVDRQLRALGA